MAFASTAMILKLKRTPAIYLVGFMGCGKSVVGALLAGRLGWAFCDVDTVIEASEGMSISRIFDTRGEPEFRRLETEMIRQCVHRVQSGSPLVISLGGGAFVRPENFDLISHNGVSIWLDCPLPLIRKRLEGTTDRPLARDPHHFELLYYARRESYAMADYRVEITSDDPDEAVRAVLALPLF
jgi:shikimate kinase